MNKSLAICACLLAGACTSMDVDPLTNGVATITHNNGGNTLEFKEYADRMIANNARLRIDGYCASACTILAEIVHNSTGNVCLTENAVMAYHYTKKTIYWKNAKTGEEFEFMTTYEIDENYRKAIVDLVNVNGGWRKHSEPIVEISEKVLVENRLFDWCV